MKSSKSEAVVEESKADPVDAVLDALAARLGASADGHEPPKKKVPPDPKHRPTEAEKIGLAWDAKILSVHKAKDGSRHVEYRIPGDLRTHRHQVKAARPVDPLSDDE